MRKSIYIFVDDIRDCNDIKAVHYDYYHISRTYEDAVTAIDNSYTLGLNIFISFDHDLGEDKSGYDIAKYLVENNIGLLGFDCHSMNPVGSANIIQLLTHYGYKYLRS